MGELISFSYAIEWQGPSGRNKNRKHFVSYFSDYFTALGATGLCQTKTSYQAELGLSVKYPSPLAIPAKRA
jgi:hypothetical protein